MNLVNARGGLDSSGCSEDGEKWSYSIYVDNNSEAGSLDVECKRASIK